MEKSPQAIPATTLLSEVKDKVGICAVIVTYHPSEELIENVNALLDQVDEVIIVDNGSGSATKELFDKLGGYAKVSVIYNKVNLGIAAALNTGIKKAMTKGYSWAATFDQDSKATPHMIELMLQAYEAYPNKEIVASLSPRYKDKNTGAVCGSWLKVSYGETVPYAEPLEVITSGNLLKLSAWEAVGYFNEALFIDYVDTEFCMRCINKGYKILEARDANLLHSIGTPTHHKLLGRMRIANNHSALRRYYITRNAIYMYRKFLFTQPAWVRKNAYVLLEMVIMIAIFETERKKKLAAVLRGLVDSLFGRMGKYTSLF